MFSGTFIMADIVNMEVQNKIISLNGIKVYIKRLSVRSVS